MRLLRKGPEPVALAAYRAVPGVRYDGGDFTPVKDAIRTALLRDQEHLCCYCMRRISTEPAPGPGGASGPAQAQMKVEHWSPQSLDPASALVWRNLLGACLGGVGVAPSDQTCDTRKGDDPIRLDPLVSGHVTSLWCNTRGELKSSDAQFQADLDKRLNLNHRVLVDARRAVLDRALAGLRAKYPTRSFPPHALRDAVAAWEGTTEGRAPAFCGTLRLWARGRFRGAGW